MRRLATTAACGGSSSTSTAPRPLASSNLASLPTRNWLTNGGSISNQRSSPLAQINAGNVAQLKGFWHIHLNSGTAGKYSGEAQPLVSTTRTSARFPATPRPG